MSAGNLPLDDEEEIPPGLEETAPERWTYTVLIELRFPDGKVQNTYDIEITSPVRLSDAEVELRVAVKIAPLLVKLGESPRLLKAMGGKINWFIVGIIETFE